MYIQNVQTTVKCNASLFPYAKAFVLTKLYILQRKNSDSFFATYICFNSIAWNFSFFLFSYIVQVSSSVCAY